MAECTKRGESEGAYSLLLSTRHVEEGSWRIVVVVVVVVTGWGGLYKKRAKKFLSSKKMSKKYFSEHFAGE
jgi:hypothetical protein